MLDHMVDGGDQIVSVLGLIMAFLIIGIGELPAAGIRIADPPSGNAAEVLVVLQLKAGKAFKILLGSTL